MKKHFYPIHIGKRCFKTGNSKSLEINSCFIHIIPQLNSVPQEFDMTENLMTF